MHFSTVLARSPAGLLSHISRLSRLYQDHVLLFALSPNAASSDLAQLVQKLTVFSPQTIGCLSAPLPGHYNGLLSCSFAMFKPESCFPFRSEISGRTAPQVGRWHSFRQKGPQTDVLHEELPSGNVEWGNVWDQSLTNNELPPGLQAVSPGEIGTIIYFSDAAPEGLSNALGRFPGATKLGLFAAPTPFITGRPVTLFKGDKIYESGAVGLALKHPKVDHARVQFLGMKALSSPMVVTQAEGNLVISLDNKNPTQLLLAAIRESGIEFAASDSLKDNNEFSLATLKADEPHQMYNIMSGDPSRGTIALRSMLAPAMGARVQFFHRPKSTIFTIPPEVTHPSGSRHTLGFIACPESRQYTHPVEVEDGVAHLFHDTFLAGSEGGFISSRAWEGESEASWSCDIPGSLATLSWETPYM
ncbi:hypothetical protein B0H19DRAFT_1106656 [Mycena capillaripes]|nr:hypothetical protein B0H19DRAFT_1106656 [Mycena capillaripes]